MVSVTVWLMPEVGLLTWEDSSARPLDADGDRRARPDFLRTVCEPLAEPNPSDHRAASRTELSQLDAPESRVAIRIAYGIRVGTDLPVHIPLIADGSIWSVVTGWEHDVAG
jgi:hypothetical protein